jgi:4-hydroxy-tetrahydrodipicolinate reductase
MHPILIGTTGFTEGQLEIVKKYSESYPVLLCSNTSPGMAWIQKLLKENPFPPELGYQVIVEETHHQNKKDSPSGTAKTLLKELEQTGFTDIPVHVSRAGSVIGEHSIRWIGEGEEITWLHRVTDRKIFAKGALVGSLFLLKNKKPGLYNMTEAVWSTNHGN